MQTLPIITATPPAAPAQTPTDNNTAQVTEPFGKVLARQQANADAGDKNSPQASSSSSSSSPAPDAAATTGNEAQMVTPDTASTLPADLLAALLPAVASTDSSATKVEPDPQAPVPDGVIALPAGMLATLLPATAQSAVTGTLQRAIASGIPGGTRQSANAGLPISANRAPSEKLAADTSLANSASLPTNEIPVGTEKPAVAAPAISGQTESTQFRAQDKPALQAATADAQKRDAFSTALGASSKDIANTVLSGSTTKISAQPVLPDATAIASLTQGGAAPITSSPNGPVQVAINTPVTQDKWGDEFNQKITWLATQGEQTAELHLNPPHLGPLDVVLNVSGDQATALFTSPHAAVREAIEQALPKLRDMMADNGIMLGNAMVSDQSPKDQQAWQADQRQKGERGVSGIGDAIPTGGIQASSSVLPGRSHQGMVDTFA
jgi:flagellar hook-length control protein FliK